MIHNLLGLVHETGCVLVTNVKPRSMNDTTHTTTNSLLVDCTFNEFAFHYSNLVVINIKRVWFRTAVVGFASQIDFGQNKSHYLLARPQLLRLVNGRGGDTSIPVSYPHENVHEEVFLYKYVSFGHLLYAQQRILNDPHDGSIRLPTDNNPGAVHHQFCLGAGR